MFKLFGQIFAMQLNLKRSRLGILTALQLYRWPAATIVGGALLACILCLNLLSLAVNFAAYELNPELVDQNTVSKLVRFFDVDGEGNLPAWFSTLLLYSVALLSLIITFVHFKWSRPWKFHWLTIGLLFLLMSLDESVSLHERTIIPLRTALGVGGLLYWTWVIPGTMLVLGATVVYWRFVFNLPRQIRVLAITSASLYLAGALGVEMVGGYYFELNDGRDFLYAAITSLEEGLEMLGASLFAYTLVKYSEMTFSISLSLKAPAVPAPGYAVPPVRPPRSTLSVKR